MASISSCLLQNEGLISAKDVGEIRKGPKDRPAPVIAPNSYMYWNVHIDGLERTHDLIVEREGVFKEAILAIRMAKVLGYQVATNTTVYKETDLKEIERDVRVPLLARRGRPHHLARLRVRRGEEGHGRAAQPAPRGLLPDPQGDRREVRGHRGVGREVPDLRHPGLPGIPRRPARSHLLGLGDPDPQYPRLEGALLPDDRRPLPELPGAAGEGRVVEVRRGRTAKRAIRAAKIA